LKEASMAKGLGYNVSRGTGIEVEVFILHFPH
jgi:hypothetical protein